MIIIVIIRIIVVRILRVIIIIILRILVIIIDTMNKTLNNYNDGKLFIVLFQTVFLSNMFSCVSCV